MYVAEPRIHKNVNGCFMGNRFVRFEVANGPHSNRLLMKQLPLTNSNNGQRTEQKKYISNSCRQWKGFDNEQSPLMLELLQILIQKEIDGKGNLCVVSIEKLDKIMEVVIRHCDQQDKTKSIHKVLFLTLKYLGMRIHNKSKGLVDIERNKLLEWLSDAANLYSEELVKPPIALQNDEIGPSKRSVRDKASRLKFAISQSNTNKGGDQNKTVLENYFSNVTNIGNENKYAFLMNMLQNYELQILVANLQYVSQEITKLFSSAVEIQREKRSDIEELGRALSDKIQFCVELILKRLYLQQWTNVYGESSKSTQNMDRKNKKVKTVEKKPKVSQNFIHKQFVNFSKSLKNEKSLGRQKLSNIVFEPLKQQKNKGIRSFYEQFSELNKVLKIMMSILLGNGQALQKYCSNNIYAYLKLRMLYGNQDGERGIQDYRQISKKYLCRVNISDNRLTQENIQLLEEHKYLLNMITNPQDSQEELLYFHKIYQGSLSIFAGSQLYAHILGTIWFHCGLVYPELLVFDPEYQENIMRELIVCSSQAQKFRISYVGHDKYEIENENSFDQYSSGNLAVDDGDIGDELGKQNSYRQNLDGDNFQQQERSQESQIRHIEDCEFIHIKLFLCAVSYSKMIRESKRIKDNNLRKQMQGLNRESQNGYLHFQLVDRLILQKLSYKQIRSYNELNRLIVVVKYACQVRVGEFVENYLGHLVKISVGRGSVDGESLLVDKFGLQLMALEIKASFWILNYKNMNRELNDGDIFGQTIDSNFYNTFSFRILESGYLTSCTLENKFNYDLLQKVRELTGTNSQLRILSEEAADQFKRFWETYFEMESLTERGKLQCRKSVCHQSVRNSKVQKRNSSTEKLKVNNLEELLSRIETIIILASNNDIEGCGEVLRVAWQILQDYQDISEQCNRQVQVSPQRQSLLEQAGDRLANFVGELRGYLEMMQNQGVSSEQFRKFKKMIF